MGNRSRFFAAAAMALLLATSGVAEAASRTVVLLTGSGGSTPIDLLIRNRAAFEKAGWTAVPVDDPAAAIAAIQAARARGGKVAAVAMSHGAINLAETLRAGASVDGAVFISGSLYKAMGVFGTPELLPKRTLVIANHFDACRGTTPANAERFVAWSEGRARLRWVDVSGGDDPKPCGPKGGHGYFMQEGEAISATLQFIGGL